MKFNVRVTREGAAFRAECLERDWAATGASERAALDALRARVTDHYTRARAVAPPEAAPTVEVELIVVSR